MTMGRKSSVGHNHNDGIRKKNRANSLGLQWWRRITLPRRGKKDSQLFPKSSTEPYTESQKNRLEERTQTLRKSLLTPRVTRIKHLAEADWDDRTDTAIIRKQRGNSLKSMGEFVKGSQILYPEEALYLMDKGGLELKHGGLPMSVQKAWCLCLSSKNSLRLESYLIFAFLRRAGYVVRRYIGPPISENIKPAWSVWRVAAYTRRDVKVKEKALFHVVAYTFEDALPYLNGLAEWSTLSDITRTRIRIAVIDRGVVVFNDTASNATPLSHRFVKRLAQKEQDVAVKLKQGDASAIFSNDLLDAWDDEIKQI